MIAWWIWFGPAETKTEIARELKEMRAAGLGGVLIYPEYPLQVDDPNLGIRNLRFLSPQYLDVYRYAVRTGHELGLSVDATGGSGWPFGGPSISVDHASHAIRMRILDVPAFAFTASSLLNPGEELVAAFVSETQNGGTTWRDITSGLVDGKRVDLRSEADDRLMVFVSAPTGMKVKRPAWGGEGFVLDHLNPDGLNNYVPVLDKMVAGIPPGSLRALFADSLEAYGSDWTDDFLSQFRRRQGYSLEPHLPDLFVDDPLRTPDVRYDFWETVAGLFVDNFAHPLHEWTRRHGVELEVEAYGVPAVPQRAYKEVDLPAGEQYDWREFTEGRWASSAAHFFSKKRVLAEYATWAGIPNRFTDTLDDLKVIADLQFLTGMTELSASTLPYSPPSAGIPGWADYAGADFGLNQTWWPFFPHLTAYVQRTSFILEQGKPVSDILLYLPVEDVEASAPPGSLHTAFGVRDRLAQVKAGQLEEFGLKNALTYQAPLISAILKSGYTFDGISGDILEERGSVHASDLIIGDGAYRAVVLPRLEGMRLGAMKKIFDFVQAGGTAIAVGRLPDRVYGGLDSQGQSERLREMTEQIFGPSTADSYVQHQCRRGQGILVLDERTLVRALADAVSPDLWLSTPDDEVGFIHRRAPLGKNGSADYYFVANTSQESKLLHASFRLGHRAPQLWDMESGSTSAPAKYSFQADRTIMDLSLGPRGSVVIYFGASRQLSPLVASNLPQPVGSHGVIKANVETPGTFYVQTQKGKIDKNIGILPASIDVGGPWHLDFNPRLNLARTINQLESWTSDPATRFYSGTVRYSTSIDVPMNFLGAGKVVWLSIGDVRYAARIWINGRQVGDVWQRPYRLEITQWLRPGANELRIDVANLLVNAVLGQSPPEYTELKKLYGDRFPYPEDWKVNPEPWPSGLLGPVQLVPGVRISFHLPSTTSDSPPTK